MQTTVTFDQPPTTDAEYETMIDQQLAAMKRMQQQMDEDQSEIETLRAETDAILSNVMQLLKVA